MANSLVEAQRGKRKPAKGGPVKKSPMKGVNKETGSGPVSGIGIAPMEDQSYRAHHDMQTLHDAYKIRTDPARMSAVKDHVLSLGEALSGEVKQTDKKGSMKTRTSRR